MRPSGLKRQFSRTWHGFRRLGERRIMLILSVVVGVSSGLAAVLLKNVLHVANVFVQESFPKDSANFLFFALPATGILLTIVFVRFLVKDDIGHGVSKVLYSISKQNGRIKPHNMYSSMVASTSTIAFGGSVGAEAPIVYTGAAIGSNVGNFFRLNYKNIILLIGCGAAGAIASIFKAPLAGIVFTLEVLMLDLTTASIVPLLISAVSAATVSYFFLGREVVLAYDVVRPFALQKIPYYVLLGVFCGFISLYFIRVVMWIEKRFERITSIYRRWILGAMILGTFTFLFPPLYGEGYEVLQALLDGRSSFIFNSSPFYEFQSNVWLLLVALLILILAKGVATAVTTGAGGVGGTFAPTLFIGGVAGFFVAKLLNQLGITVVSESNFALIGMAGAMAGVMHAPLTAIFLIAEITGGYALFVPLIITSTISFLTILYFEPYSIYTKNLAKRGELITHHKDKAVLTMLSVRKVLETDFTPVEANQTLGDLVKIVGQSKRNIFPVVQDDGQLVGVVTLDDIRSKMFDTSAYTVVHVQDIMTLAPAVIDVDEPMEKVMQKFEDTGAWNLPVLDNGYYVGFI
ncbi:MAG TPA: chloride channel protein, partial [Tenuifilaceae bacterium]|nr:chloride channel protein [Tenuifilaceae bacterium]